MKKVDLTDNFQKLFSETIKRMEECTNNLHEVPTEICIQIRDKAKEDVVEVKKEEENNSQMLSNFLRSMGKLLESN